MGPPTYSNFRTPYNGNTFLSGRPSNRFMAAQPSSAWNRAENRASTRGGSSSQDRFDARRRSFHNWYVNNYPTWPGYGYPYLIDPGFYDWGDSDNSAPDDSDYNQSAAAPYYTAPNPDYGVPGETPQEGTRPAYAPGPQRIFAGPAFPSAPGQPLTVIFKSGRDPVKMQNYMLTAKVLTDLDSQHHEQIPIDQIDVVATQWANNAAGVRFEIPSTSRD
jgi:hypothetical protein